MKALRFDENVKGGRGAVDNVIVHEIMAWILPKDGTSQVNIPFLQPITPLSQAITPSLQPNTPFLQLITPL
jgi:hypothetical protein